MSDGIESCEAMSKTLYSKGDCDIPPPIMLQDNLPSLILELVILIAQHSHKMQGFPIKQPLWHLTVDWLYRTGSGAACWKVMTLVR